MQFPRIRYCLVCEDVRAEAGNKSTIVGFFGVAPDVEIVYSAGVEFADLAFLIGTETTANADDARRLELDSRLCGPDGNELGRSGGSLSAPVEHQSVLAALDFRDIRVSMDGEYRLTVIIDGRMEYEARFRITHQPGDVLIVSG